jgi:hypothetical protein
MRQWTEPEWGMWELLTVPKISVLTANVKVEKRKITARGKWEDNFKTDLRETC